MYWRTNKKNFSFILRQKETWTLAPAYDLTLEFDPRSKWVSQHLMSVNGKFLEISRDDLLHVANRFSIGNAERILEMVQEAVQAWAEFAKSAQVSPGEIERIRLIHKQSII